MKKVITLTMFLIFALLVTTGLPDEKRVVVPLGESPSMGPENAPVIIVEFIDFQ